jgi:hypothetical protein
MILVCEDCPAGPAGPIGPRGPCGPEGPCVPAVPIGPGDPGCPSSPLGPLESSPQLERNIDMAIAATIARTRILLNFPSSPASNRNRRAKAMEKARKSSRGGLATGYGFVGSGPAGCGRRARAILTWHSSNDEAAVPSLHSNRGRATTTAGGACGVTAEFVSAAAAFFGSGSGASTCCKRAQPTDAKTINRTMPFRILSPREDESQSAPELSSPCRHTRGNVAY